MTPDLTAIDLQVFDYVRDMITECGAAPTLSEISDRFDFRSRTVARQHVDNAVSAGLLVRTTASERNLDVVEREPVNLSLVATGALHAELLRRSRPFQTPWTPPTRFTRPCGAVGCREHVRRGHLLCLAHWKLLPNNLRDELVTANRVRNEAAYADAWRRATDILEIARHVR